MTNIIKITNLHRGVQLNHPPVFSFNPDNFKQAYQARARLFR